MKKIFAVSVLLTSSIAMACIPIVSEFKMQNSEFSFNSMVLNGDGIEFQGPGEDEYVSVTCDPSEYTRPAPVVEGEPRDIWLGEEWYIEQSNVFDGYAEYLSLKDLMKQSGQDPLPDDSIDGLWVDMNRPVGNPGPVTQMKFSVEVRNGIRHSIADIKLNSSSDKSYVKIDCTYDEKTKTRTVEVEFFNKSGKSLGKRKAVGSKETQGPSQPNNFNIDFESDSVLKEPEQCNEMMRPGGSVKSSETAPE